MNKLKRLKTNGYLPMHLFSFLYELALYNHKALNIVYPNGYSSYEILYRGSKDLPRKEKKKLRKLLC